MTLSVRLSPATVTASSLEKINKSRPGSEFPDSTEASKILDNLREHLHFGRRETSREYEAKNKLQQWQTYNTNPSPLSHSQVNSYYARQYIGKPKPAPYTPKSPVLDPNLASRVALLASHPSEQEVLTLMREFGSQILEAATGKDLKADPKFPSYNQAMNTIMASLWPILVERVTRDLARYEYTVLLDRLYELTRIQKLYPTPPLPPIETPRLDAALSESPTTDVAFSLLKAYVHPPFRKKVTQACPKLLLPEEIGKLVAQATPDMDLLTSLISSEILSQESERLIVSWITSSILMHTEPSYTNTLTRAIGERALLPTPTWLDDMRVLLASSSSRRHRDHLASAMPWPNPALLSPAERKQYDALTPYLDQAEPQNRICWAYEERLVNTLLDLKLNERYLNLVRPSQLESLTTKQWARLAAYPDASVTARSFLFRHLRSVQSSISPTV